MWNRYGKALVAILSAIFVVIASSTSGDGRVSGEEWFQIAMAGGTAVSVYLVPAVPEWPWMKTAVAAVLVGVEVAGSLAIDGWSLQDSVNVVIAVLGAAFIAVAPTSTVQRHIRTS